MSFRPLSAATPAANLAAEITLRFTLPASLQLCVPPGRWIGPCIHQARVDVGDEVEIRAFNGSLLESKRIVFEQARRFLIKIAGGEKRLPRESFTARLAESHKPDRYQHYAIVIGASISITHAFESPALVG
jgi:hypothetical protein